MPSFITPARLASLVGVATGLGAAATALAGFFTVGSALGNGIVAAAGVLGTVGTVAKFLEGQAGWEQLRAAHAHALVQQDAAHVQALQLAKLATAAPPVVVADGDPIDAAGDTGDAPVHAVEPDSGEPQRLHDLEA